ncbi:MAG: NAD(P)H-hydrate dehydratase, partial [Pseudomonadota bacterium]
DSGAILMEPWPGGPAKAFWEDGSVSDYAASPKSKRPLYTDLTVAFHCPKPGHFLDQGPRVCGKLSIVDIDLVQSAYDPGVARLVAKPRPHIWDKARAPRGSDHKYDHGHALVLSGPLGRSGAARLAARGALRVGAGLVTVAAPQGAMAECAAQLTAIMLRKVEGAAEFHALLEDSRLNALCLGPGLGLERARELVPVALQAERATVLDADALTAFADTPEDLFDKLHESVVLTPHEGEFARLFPDIYAEWKAPAKRGPAYSKLDAAREAAARAGCTVLLKGPDTVIAEAPDYAAINASVYDRATPWLATAGSGDVLAGLITGLMARRFAPVRAAGTGAWLHSEAALKFGPGLIAEDLPEQIPAVFADLTPRA